MLPLHPEAIAREREIVCRVVREAVGHDYLGVSAGPGVTGAFAYIRVSSDRQAEADRTGLNREIQDIDGLALKSGVHIPLASVYADDYTGQEERRPSFDRLIPALRESPSAERQVFVEQMDRLGRVVGVQYLVEREIKRAGGQVRLVKELDEATKSLMGAVAEIEIVKMRERVRKANLTNMARGSIISHQPRFGYLIQRQNGVNVFVKDPTTFGAPRLVHEIFARKGSISEVRAEFLLKKILAPRGGRVWSTDSIYSILRDETYTGTHHQNRYVVERTGEYTQRGKPRTKTVERPREEWIPVEVPVLVDAFLFASNQRRLEANAGRAGRPSKTQTLLRGILFCGACGRRMTLQKGNGEPRYRCPRRSDSELRRNGQPKCDQVSPTVIEVDGLVWAEVSKDLLQPELLYAQVCQQAEDARAVSGGRDELKRLLEESDRALERARRAFDKALAGESAMADEMAQALARARERRNAAAVALSDAATPARLPTLDDVRRQLAPLDPDAIALEKRHQIVAALLDRVTLAGDGQSVQMAGVLTRSVAKSFGSAPRSGCVPIGSSSERSVAAKRSTCCRR